ncbi:MAG: hypothetical protein K0Q95_2991 [Bacteroidota bacterium]|jgi:hypothetical protein|nr:hypothetical protein [Bacteroidota bacterium]
MDTDTIINKRKVKKESLKQKIHNPPLVLKTSPTAFLYGAIFPPYTSEYRLMAEISSGKRQSEQLGVSLLATNIFLPPVERAAGIAPADFIKVRGWRVQFAHKFYWIGKRHYAPFGFFFAPMVSYTNARISLGLNRFYKQGYFDFRHFNINGIIGVQAGKINRVTFEVYGGLGYKVNKVFYHSSAYRVQPYDTEEFGPMYNSHLNGVFGINMGYAL